MSIVIFVFSTHKGTVENILFEQYNVQCCDKIVNRGPVQSTSNVQGV